MNILHVIFSTNRIDYLTKSLESWKYIDYGEHTVTRVIIDDYPFNRNNAIFNLFAKMHNCLIWLHEENKGLSVTWTEFFQWVRQQNYDYILHQEDDVILNEPIKINDLIDVLNTDKNITSVTLERQAWYEWESEPMKNDSDIKINQFYGYKNYRTFPIIFSFYKKEIADIRFEDIWKINVNEGMIMSYLVNQLGMYNLILKNSESKALITHIGEKCTGKRVLEGEPGWENFKHMDPNKFYNSRTGQLL
jgi:hypothetical protein